MINFLFTLGQVASALVLLYGGYLVFKNLNIFGTHEVSRDEEQHIFEHHLQHE